MKTHDHPLATYSLTIVVPAYNEQEVLPEFQRRLANTLEKIPEANSKILYINDGSNDSTLDVLLHLAQEDERISIIDLSRNFGKEAALSAGLDHADSDAVVVIDADLQDPPEMIPQLVSGWQEGYDVVYAKRTMRTGETLAKIATAHLFYRLFRRISDLHLPEDTGDFRLLSRRCVKAIRDLREQHRFMKGLFTWIGFPQLAIPYQREPRLAGKTKWNYWKLWNFALEGITSFSNTPLKAASYFGMSVAFLALLFAIWIIAKTLIFGEPVQGYPTIMVTMLFLGGVQLIAIGILGEYIGRIFDETKKRPLYFINRRIESPPIKKQRRQIGAVDR